SGVKHDVSDAPYATARTAAFMGKKWLEAHFELRVDYLTQFSMSNVLSLSERELPSRISGEDFLHRFATIDDPLSEVQAGKIYPLRNATLFAIEEHSRCQLTTMWLQKSEWALIGKLMFESHDGYTSIGLGSPETDDMVNAIRELGTTNGFYGARISGGGSGGTVVVLARRDALPLLQSLAPLPSTLIY
ncbi:hypothetical protein EON80_13035, partial [bacterium]